MRVRAQGVSVLTAPRCWGTREDALCARKCNIRAPNSIFIVICVAARSRRKTRGRFLVQGGEMMCDERAACIRKFMAKWLEFIGSCKTRNGIWIIRCSRTQRCIYAFRDVSSDAAAHRSQHYRICIIRASSSVRLRKCVRLADIYSRIYSWMCHRRSSVGLPRCYRQGVLLLLWFFPVRTVLRRIIIKAKTEIKATFQCLQIDLIVIRNGFGKH